MDVELVALMRQEIAEARRDIGRIVLLGMLGTMVVTAGMCLGTLVLVL